MAEPPTAKLLAEYDDGIACTVWLVRKLDVDEEVDIPRTGLGDRRKYTCNMNAVRLTVEHTVGRDALLIAVQDGVSHVEKQAIAGLSNLQELFSQNVLLMTLQVKPNHKLNNSFLWSCRVIPHTV